MIIRRLKGHDIPFVQKINHSTLPENYTLQFIAVHYIFNPLANYIALLDNKIIGYLLGENNGMIISLAVDEKYRNRNIGTALMNVYMEKMTTRSAFLCVRVSNFKAIRFYLNRFHGDIKYVLREYYFNGEDAYFIEILKNA